MQTTGSLKSADFDATSLCLPTKRGTLLAVLCASSFTFLGLLAFSFAELGFANLPNQSSKRRLVDAPVAVAGLGVYVLHACDVPGPTHPSQLCHL